MAGRIRSIKPELLEDAIAAGLSDTAFRLFIAAILMADDYGFFRAETPLIRGNVYWKSEPSGDVEGALDELRVGRLVVFYTVRGQRYGAIRTWEKNQRVQKRGKPRLPGPDQAECVEPPDSGEKPSGVSPETPRPDLRSPIIDHRSSTTDQRPPAAPPERGEDPPGETRNRPVDVALAPGTGPGVVTPPAARIGAPAEPKKEPGSAYKAPERVVDLGTARSEALAEAFVGALEEHGRPRPPLRQRWERQALCDAVNTHLRADGTAEGIIAELRRAVAEWVLAFGGDDERFTSGWGAAKFGEWLSAGRRRARTAASPPAARPRSRPAAPPAVDEPATPPTPEEAAELAAALDAMVEAATPKILRDLRDEDAARIAGGKT